VAQGAEATITRHKYGSGSESRSFVQVRRKTKVLYLQNNTAARATPQRVPKDSSTPWQDREDEQLQHLIAATQLSFMLQTPTESLLTCCENGPIRQAKKEMSMLRSPEIVVLIGLFGLSTAFGATLFFLRTINFRKISRK
jgi:hypothetical protein